MPVSIVTQTTVSKDAFQQRATAASVLAEFGGSLPDIRLLCFLDDEEGWEVKQQYGEWNRGFALPINFDGPDETIYGWHIVPPRVRQHILTTDKDYALQQKVDYLVYLHGSVAARRTSLVMTLAHELQHFCQYGNRQKLWALSSLLMQFDRDFYKSTRLKMWDIPTEREARIVAKQIAVNVCGVEAVMSYIEECIEKRVNPADVDDWKFVRDLPLSSAFDLETDTRQLYRKLRPFKDQISSKLHEFAAVNQVFSNIDLFDLME